VVLVFLRQYCCDSEEGSLLSFSSGSLRVYIQDEYQIDWKSIWLCPE
jgi:hypothetical protein